MRLRKPDNWFTIVDRDGDKGVNVAELTTYLTKIEFKEPMNFIAELRKKDEEFKSSNPTYLDEIKRIMNIKPKTPPTPCPGEDITPGGFTPGGDENNVEPYDACIFHDNQRYYFKQELGRGA